MCNETVGSESVVSYDTAEQSIVSHSEVIKDALTVTEDNPETFPLAVNDNIKPTNTHNNQPRVVTQPA